MYQVNMARLNSRTSSCIILCHHETYHSIFHRITKRGGRFDRTMPPHHAGGRPGRRDALAGADPAPAPGHGLGPAYLGEAAQPAAVLLPVRPAIGAPALRRD